MHKTHGWIVLLSSLLVCGMLVACGEKEPPTPTAVPPTPTSAATSTPVATPTASAGDHLDRGVAYFEQDLYEQAIAAFGRAIQLDPDDANAHYNLALSFYHTGQLDQAIAGYEEAVRLQPDHASAHYNMGRVYYEQGKLEEAIGAWKETIRIDPGDSMAHNNVGRALFEQGRIEEAIAELREAIRLDHQNPLPRFNLGLLYGDQGLTGEAIAELEAYLELIPADDPTRNPVEGQIEKLRGARIEYRNRQGGYVVPYPGDLFYDHDGTLAVFSGSQAAVEAALDDAWADALQQAAFAIFDAMPLDELAKDYGLEADAGPLELVRATAQDLGAKTGQIETGNLRGHPAALVQIMGDFDDTAYIGVLGIIVVEGRVIAAVAIAQPDEWDAFWPTFITMFDNLSFFRPEE